MIKALTKKVTLILLLSLLSSQFVHAEIKNYQYDGKLPFVQMMLNMMVVMGILDRVPVNGIYNRYGQYGMSNNRYADLWNRGYSRNNTAWGQPRWGVLPEGSYSQNNSSWYGPQGMSPIMKSDLDGWVNEPWEMSVWNNNKNKKEVSEQSSNETLVKDNSENQSQSTKQVINKRPARLKQKACVTDFCGLEAPSLNGLWISQEGEMFGVKNNNFLWSDGQSRHLTGNLQFKNNYLLVNADGYQQPMYFKYKLDGNYLLTMQPDGRVREFRRVSNGQSGSSGYLPRGYNSSDNYGDNYSGNNNFMQGNSRDYY